MKTGEDFRREFPQADAEDIRSAAARSGGWLGQARQMLLSGDTVPPQTEQFVRSFAQRDVYGLIQTLVPMEKWKRDALITELENWVQLLENALAYRSGMNAVSPAARDIGTRRSSADLMNAIVAVQKGIEYAQINVSTGAICGWLSWALR